MKSFKIQQSITLKESGSFTHYLKEVSQQGLISPEAEVELATRAAAGDQLAIDALVKGNLRFVISVAKKYSGCGLSLEDLVSEGNIGLIKAAQKFDPQKGVKFITYAVWWIRQSILQGLALNSRTIRLPQNQINQLQKIGSLQSQLMIELQRPATYSELAQELGIDPDQVRLTLSSAQSTWALDTPLSDEGEFSLLDTLASESETDAPLLAQDLSKALFKYLDLLETRERFVLTSLFGLESAPQTPLEVSQKLGVGPERVRQIKTAALKKLRRFSAF